MDSKFWIWLIIIAVSFIANQVKKKRERDAKAEPLPPRDRNPNPAPNPSRTAPMSFEELLAEIQGSKQPAPKPAPVTEFVVEDYDDEAIARSKKREEKAASYNYRKDDQIYEIYDNAKKHAFERKSLEETLKLADTDTRFGAFKGYERQVTASLAAEFAREIRNPSGFKKAFIMSEILQRRF